MRDPFLVLSQSYSPSLGPLHPLPASYSHTRGQDSPIITMAAVMVAVLITVNMMAALRWCWRKAMACFCPTRAPFPHRRIFSVQAPVQDDVQLMSIPSRNLAIQAPIQAVVPVAIGNLDTGAKKFSYQLATASDNFSKILGEGGFGSVYEGKLDDLTKVAIKKLKSDSQQGVNEYKSEVTTLGRLRHRNVVRLIGWCHDSNDLLLVYELMPKGSLDIHLHSDDPVLPWGRRYKIALDLAYALAYIHEDFDGDYFVLHKDIKPSNIMIGENFDAKLGDFGLARLVDHGQSALTTKMTGTFGYADPYSRGDDKSDMYSFGVVLLVIATGLPAITQVEGGRRNIIELVSKKYNNGGWAVGLADPRLQGNFKPEQLDYMIHVGLRCVQTDPTMRPSAKEAIKVLESAMSLEEILMAGSGHGTMSSAVSGSPSLADTPGRNSESSSLIVNTSQLSSVVTGSSDGGRSSAVPESSGLDLVDTFDLNSKLSSSMVNTSGVLSVVTGSSDGGRSSAVPESSSLDLADTPDPNSECSSSIVNTSGLASGTSDGTMYSALLDSLPSDSPRFSTAALNNGGALSVRSRKPSIQQQENQQKMELVDEFLELKASCTRTVGQSSPSPLQLQAWKEALEGRMNLAGTRLNRRHLPRAQE